MMTGSGLHHPHYRIQAVDIGAELDPKRGPGFSAGEMATVIAFSEGPWSLRPQGLGFEGLERHHAG
jgi:hypothetical protein